MQFTDSKEIIACNGNAVLLTSTSGVGVLHIALQIKERLLYYMKGESKVESAVNIEIVYVDQAQLELQASTVSPKEISTLLVENLRQQIKSSSNQKNIAIVCFITSPIAYIPCSDIIHAVSISCNYQVCMSIAVVSPTLLDPKPEVLLIGNELPYAHAVENCKSTVCNCVIVVTVNSAAYGKFRQWLELHNPMAVFYKVTCTNQWLDDECLSNIANSLPNLNKSNLSKKVTSSNKNYRICNGDYNSLSIGSVVNSKQVQSVVETVVAKSYRLTENHYLAGLHSLKSFIIEHQHQNSNKPVIWDITSLINVFKLIFPDAILSNTVNCDVWNPNCLYGKQIPGRKDLFSRAQLLTAIKIFCRKQVANVRECNKNVLIMPNIIKALTLKKIHSVHGFIRVKSGLNGLNADNEVLLQNKLVFNPDTTFAVIDANANHIIIRPLPIHTLDNSLVDRLCDNKFHLLGCINENDKPLLTSAFTSCVLNELPLKPFITADDTKKIFQSRESSYRHKNLKKFL